MSKIKKMIPVYIDEEYEDLIDNYIEANQVYKNINAGILLEPLFETIFGKHFKTRVIFVNKYGHDYNMPALNKVLEFKSLVVTKYEATAKNVGESKKGADFLALYHPKDNRLFVIEMKYLNEDKFEFTWDKRNNTYHLRFCPDFKNLSTKRKEKTIIIKNTEALLKYGKEITV